MSRRTIYNRIREGSLETVKLANGTQRVTIESIAVLMGIEDRTFDAVANCDAPPARRYA